MYFDSDFIKKLCIGIGSVILLALLVLGGLFFVKNRKNKREDVNYSYYEIELATTNNAKLFIEKKGGLKIASKEEVDKYNKDIEDKKTQEIADSKNNNGLSVYNLIKEFKKDFETTCYNASDFINIIKNGSDDIKYICNCDNKVVFNKKTKEGDVSALLNDFSNDSIKISNYDYNNETIYFDLINKASNSEVMLTEKNLKKSNDTSKKIDSDVESKENNKSKKVDTDTDSKQDKSKKLDDENTKKGLFSGLFSSITKKTDSTRSEVIENENEKDKNITETRNIQDEIDKIKSEREYDDVKSTESIIKILNIKDNGDYDLSYIDKIFTTKSEKTNLATFIYDLNQKDEKEIIKNIINGKYKTLINTYILILNEIKDNKFKNLLDTDEYKIFTLKVKDLYESEDFKDLKNEIEKINKKHKKTIDNILNLFNMGEYSQIVIKFNSGDYDSLIKDLYDTLTKEKYKENIEKVEQEIVSGDMSDFVYLVVYAFFEITYRYNELITNLSNIDIDYDVLFDRLGYNVDNADNYKNRVYATYKRLSNTEKFGLYINRHKLLFITLIIISLIIGIIVVIFGKKGIISIPNFERKERLDREKGRSRKLDNNNLHKQNIEKEENYFDGYISDELVFGNNNSKRVDNNNDDMQDNSKKIDNTTEKKQNKSNGLFGGLLNGKDKSKKEDLLTNDMVDKDLINKGNVNSDGVIEEFEDGTIVDNNTNTPQNNDFDDDKFGFHATI